MSDGDHTPRTAAQPSDVPRGATPAGEYADPQRHGRRSGEAGAPHERARAAAAALRRKISLALASALLVLAVGVAAAAAVLALVRSADQVDRTERTLDRLDALLLHLDDAETGQRGFVITGDSSYLEPYLRARRSVTADTLALRLATRDSRLRSASLDTLFPIVRAKLGELGETIALRSEQGFASASAVVLSARGKRQMDEIRLRVRRMEAAERQLLATRSSRLRAGTVVALGVIALGSAVALALALVLDGALRRDVVEQERAGRALERQAEQLQDQAAELEHQIEMSQSLAEEAELSAQQARDAADDAELARERAEESERRFRETANSAPVLIWTAGTDGRRDWFSRPWLDFTGRAMEQEVGDGWVDDVHPDDVPSFLEIYNASVLERRPFSTEYRLRRHDGEYRWLVVNGTPRFAADGTFLGYVGACVDITAQRRASDTVAFLGEAGRLVAGSLDVEAALAALTRHAVPFLADYCSVDMLTERGEIRRVETAHVDPEKEAIVRDVWAAYPYRAEERVGVPEVIRSGEPQLHPTMSEDQLTAFARDERHLAALLRLGPRSYVCVPLTARGHTYGAISLVMSDSGRRYDESDVAVATELARRAATAVDNARLYAEAEDARRRADEARDAAERASRSKSDFLATMSHEIRTPINAIIGYTQLMELEITGPVSDAQRQQLARVSSSGRHLLGLIEDVLDLAKVEAGRLTVTRERAAVAGAVEASLALVRPQAAARGVALGTDGDDGHALHYLGDEQRVQQILVNLLSNAVKFTEPGGRVTVRCTRAVEAPRESAVEGAGPWIVLAVEDTGVGITSDKLERIFRPFEQGESGYTRPHSGTGLGLTISRRLARLMEGDLTVESAPGRGSVFSLWLHAAGEGSVVSPVSVVRDADGRWNALATERGLADLAHRLRRNLDRLVARYVARLRSDPRLPDAARLTDLQLQDHTATWLAEVTQALVILAGAHGEPAELLRDGAAIQQLVAERHGSQRHRLGWDEEALARDFTILAEVIESELGGHAGDGAGESPEARELLRRFVAQAEQASRRALRHAAQTMARPTLADEPAS